MEENPQTRFFSRPDALMPRPPHPSFFLKLNRQPVSMRREDAGDRRAKGEPLR